MIRTPIDLFFGLGERGRLARRHQRLAGGISTIPWAGRDALPGDRDGRAPRDRYLTSLKLTLDYHPLHKDYELNKMQTRRG